jgi:hypothetical protein
VGAARLPGPAGGIVPSVIESFAMISRLATAPVSEAPGAERLQYFFSLWTATALLGLLVVLLAVVLLAGRHRRRLRAGRERRRELKDAWVEAGRRMPTPPPLGGTHVTDEERS